MNENPSGTGALVQVEGVEKVFHRGSEDIHVLTDLNMQVPTGEFLALMGPSGSGKSTLLNWIVRPKARSAWRASALINCPTARSPRGARGMSALCSSFTI